MDTMRCGPFAAWAGAWLAGSVPFDDVIVALSPPVATPAFAAPAGSRRAGSAGAGTDGDAQPAQLGELLISWRRSGASVRLILPVAGDVRGCPGPVAFRVAALEAGQAVVGGTVAAIPLLIDHRPSSAPPTLTWQRYDVEPASADFVPLADAQYELTEAIREGATAIAREMRGAGEPDGSTDVSDELAAARRAGERLNLPPIFPPRAVMLLAQAERMAAVLSIAGVGAYPIERDAGEDRARALEPLVIAVRRARLAGYNALN